METKRGLTGYTLVDDLEIGCIFQLPEASYLKDQNLLMIDTVVIRGEQKDFLANCVSMLTGKMHYAAGWELVKLINIRSLE